MAYVRVGRQCTVQNEMDWAILKYVKHQTQIELSRNQPENPSGANGTALTGTIIGEEAFGMIEEEL